jgi:hypothetical protein
MSRADNSGCTSALRQTYMNIARARPAVVGVLAVALAGSLAACAGSSSDGRHDPKHVSSDHYRALTYVIADTLRPFEKPGFTYRYNVYGDPRTDGRIAIHLDSTVNQTFLDAPDPSKIDPATPLGSTCGTDLREGVSVEIGGTVSHLVATVYRSVNCTDKVGDIKMNSEFSSAKAVDGNNPTARGVAAFIRSLPDNSYTRALGLSVEPHGFSTKVHGRVLTSGDVQLDGTGGRTVTGVFTIRGPVTKPSNGHCATALLKSAFTGAAVAFEKRFSFKPSANEPWIGPGPWDVPTLPPGCYLPSATVEQADPINPERAKVSADGYPFGI